MPRYRFHSVDATGANQVGEVDANDPEAAFARIERRGLSVELLEEVPAADREAGELSREDVADFARQLGGLARSGVPLHTALRALADEMPAGNLRSLFRAVSTNIARGMPLEEAIDQQSHRFPAHVRGLVLAGARSGKLGEILSEFSEHEESAADVQRRLWLNLSYPIILVVAACLLFVLLAKYIVKDFESIFTDFGLDLSDLTKNVIRASTAVNRLGPWIILGPLIAFLSLWMLERLALGAAAQRRLLVQMPLFGGLWKWSALAEFAHLLGVLVESEMPLPEAVILSGKGCHDPSLSEASERIAEAVANGQPLSHAITQRTEFPPGFAQMLHWAESSRSLPETLHMAAEIYESKARTHASVVGTVISVMTIILIVFGVVYVYAALFYPLYQLIERLS
jgi:type II secretory pathway component PulF